MDKSYSFISESIPMIILCGVAILFVMVQSVLFFKTAWKRAIEIDIPLEERKQIVKSSAIFSIVPSLPIIISYMILLPALGTYFPWLRLSVIGSATYETMAANMAATAFGYESLNAADFPPQVYVTIMWAVTLGIILSSMSVLILKSYDKKMLKVSSSKNSFGALIAPIMFMCLMATFSAPYLINFKNIVGMITLISSAGSMFLLDKASKKFKPLKEFSFSLSMIAGMASACIVSSIMGGI